MKRNLLISLFITLLAVSSFANPVDLATAKTVAANFWSAVTGSSDDGRWTDVASQTGFHEFYLLTRNTGEGFVIVAADNRVQPILGYSIDNAVTTPLPPHVNAFLRGYELEIAYCREHDTEATEAIISLWTSLLENEYTPQLVTVVSPMLTTTWNQSPFYNNLCPSSDGQHAVAGCTATATAQIMKFWNWPPSGVGSHSYLENDFGYQSADFGATTYEWENMPNALSAGSNATQVNAVATLMYHVGVAVEMDYGIDGSGASVHAYGSSYWPSSENALKDYFRYKNTLYSLYKDYTSDADWVNALYTELDNGRPVLETGYGDGGGHAFVCDGYDNNGLFHINWGWGGYMDGYFAHNALNPGTGGVGGNNDYTFNDSKGILVGIEPEGILAVSPSQLFLPQGGGGSTITVSPNIGDLSPWYATSDQSWLTLSPNNGYSTGGSATVTATATANNSDGERTATVTVTQGAHHVTLQVIQLADSCTIVHLPWSDSFEEGIGCWTTLDADGDGHNWSIATGAANSGTHAMLSYSYHNDLGGSLHTHNYLVSPPIALPAEGNHEFVFHARCGTPNYPDTLMVKLTTGEGIAASQFSATLLPLTPINSTDYQQFIVNLSAYNGQTVKVAIVHKAYDGHFLSVDDIFILNTSATCTVTTLSANGAMGTAYGSGTYNAGATVMLAATAGDGYRFTGWNDGSDMNPRLVTALGDATYIASFANLGGSEHHYDNGSPTELVGTGTGGSLSWGIRFPAGELSKFTTYSGTRFWTYESGDYQVRIYQGGDNAPDTLVATQSYTLTGNDSWYDAMLTTPVTIDHTQPLWVILYNDSTTFPAIGSNYAGNPDGSWISENGNDWGSICDYNLDVTWMIRALLTGTSATPHYTLSVGSDNTDMGLISGGGTFVAGDSTDISATALPGYRFTGWNDGNTENPRTVNIVSDSTFTAQFSNLGDSVKHYDNGTYAQSIGAGGTLHWAVRFPAGTLAGHDQLSEVKILDKNAGTYTLEVYQGGSHAPETLITSDTITFSGSNDWRTDTLATPVSLNHELPLWIVLHNTGVSYPAAGSHYAGNPDGSWVSVDNQTWSSICDHGFHYTWMIRAGLTDAAVITFHTITAASADASQGGVSGGGTYPEGSTVTLKASAASNHHFVQWDDGSTENPRTITVTGDASYTAQFEPNTYTITVVSEQPDMGTATGGGSFPYGSVIQIEAIPFDGYEFQRWTGGNTDNPRTVTVTGNKGYSALFRVAAGIDDHEQTGVTVFSQGNRIVVDGAEGQTVEIYDMTGKRIARDTQDANHRVFTMTASGVYTVKTGNGVSKRVTVVR